MRTYGVIVTTVARSAAAAAALTLLSTLALVEAADRVPPSSPVVDVPRATTRPTLTAAADDPAWARAATFSLAPNRATTAPTAQSTRFWLTYDDAALYVRVRCDDDDVRSDFTQPDDPLYKADAVELFLDPVGDGLQWYEVQVSPRNVVFDLSTTVTAPPELQPDETLAWSFVDREVWPNPGYQMLGLRTAAARVKADSTGGAGWIVDIAVPREALLRRMPKDAAPRGRSVRANFIRVDHPAGQGAVYSHWSEVRLGCPHVSPARMGTLRLGD